MADVSDMRLSVRLKPDLAGVLVEAARVERRSVSDMARLLIADGLVRGASAQSGGSVPRAEQVEAASADRPSELVAGSIPAGPLQSSARTRGQRDARAALEAVSSGGYAGEPRSRSVEREVEAPVIVPEPRVMAPQQVDPLARPRGARKDCRHGTPDCRVCRTGRFGGG